MDYSINFPNLGIYLDHVGKSIMIGNFSVAYYGIVIAIGMICGITLASHLAKISGQNPDDYFDVAIWAIIAAIIGARLYYVAFRWDLYQDNPIDILNIRQGGLAIYGGVIAGVLAVVLFAVRKHLNICRMLDTAGCGLILGQIIGRWGNFFNREAFGGYTNNLLAMQLPVSAVRSSEITAEQMANIVTVNGVQYIQVHPTFLYEGMWNLGVLILMLLLYRRKKFEGQVFLLYLFGYGLGRFWIEGLRTDQLLMPVIHYPVSRALAAILVIVSLALMIVGSRSGNRKENEKKTG